MSVIAMVTGILAVVVVVLLEAVVKVVVCILYTRENRSDSAVVDQDGNENGDSYVSWVISDNNRNFCDALADVNVDDIIVLVIAV